VQKEKYTNRAGYPAYRTVKGTGKRVFLPEYLLKRAGFEVFRPIKEDWRIKNRFTKEKHLVAIPLLADWIFVGMPIVDDECGRHVRGWAQLMAMDLVAGVMGTGGKPIALSDAAILRIMRQFSCTRVAGPVRRRVNARRAVRVGETARFVQGAFSDFEGEVIDVKGQAARVVLNLFGREAPVTADLVDLTSV